MCFGCTDPKAPKARPESTCPKVGFEYRSLQKESGKCSESEELCARIDIKFPLIKNTPNKVDQLFNNQILAFLIQTIAFEEPNEPTTEALLYTMADSFLLEWQTSLENECVGDPGVGWYVPVEGEAGLLTGKSASMSLSVESYADGALPTPISIC